MVTETPLLLPSEAVVDNIIVYIAGFVVRKAEKCIRCVDCRSVLSKRSAECGRDTSNVLFNYRQLGGLTMPSDDVVKIVRFAELQLRCLSPLNRATLQCTSRKLQASVLQQFGDKPLFAIESHFSETQSGIDNHYFDLLRVIVDILGGEGGLRLHHIIRLHNIGLKISCIRKKN